MISSRDRVFLFLLILGAFALFAQAARHTPAYVSMEKKVALLEAGPTGASQNVSLTQDELNAYFNEGGVQLPKGLSKVKLDLNTGVVHATAEVNFDQLSEGRGGGGNPIFSALFSGTHDVEAEAQASGAGGQGTVTIQSVKLDGVQVPKSALEYLIQHYVKPKYPQAGMTSTFELPAKIDSATLEQGQVTLVQKQ
jgi:hypothetical protein